MTGDIVDGWLVHPHAFRRDDSRTAHQPTVSLELIAQPVVNRRRR